MRVQVGNYDGGFPRHTLDATSMHLFERNTEVDRLVRTLDRSTAQEDVLELQVTIAWYLRQRDNTRAMALCETASAVIAARSASNTTRQLDARLKLIVAETQWLNSDLAAAMQSAQDTLGEFEYINDPVGCADSYGLLAVVHNSGGDLPQRDAALANAVSNATLARDDNRAICYEANQARYATLRDTRMGSAQWFDRFQPDQRELHPSASASVFSYFAARDHNTGNFGGALAHMNLAFEAAMQSGQSLNAVVAAVNTGSTYVSLNDHDAALEWLQRGLDVARSTGWAIALGPCLRQMGEVMCAMGRMESAQSLLDDALVSYGPVRNSRNFTMVLTALGDLALARGDYPRALEHFQQTATRAQHLAQTDTAMEGHIGIANASLRLGRIGEAEASANTALSVARGQGAIAHEVSALRLLARIHSERGDHAGATTHFEQALETARKIDGYLIPSDLMFALAEQYARAERYADAYRMVILANTARERVLNQEASNRATALQVRLGTERSRAESERHQRMADAETRRAELLQQSSDTLALLGAIGQEITSQLDKEHVFSTIEHHVHGLLDASSFAIYLMDADGLGLTSVYDIEEGVRLPGDHVRLDDPSAYSAMCVRERRELLLDFTNPLLPANYVPDSLRTVSGLFAPLSIADRILGVMTIQSTKPHVYADNERLIFRTLCAYAAIALDNAVAYSHLRDAKDQLVVQEKLAALGSLVAGVAHEINTPIGNSLLTASTLQQNTSDLEAAAASGTMRRSTLSDYIASTQEGLALVIRGLHSAGDLVQSFKQVAVDRATEQRRTFELLRTSQEVIATLQRAVQVAGHHLLVDIPAGITLDGYPGPYGQVLTNLINNALLHAFGSRKGGTMELRAHMLRNGQVEVRFSDDGVGIAAENLSRIFDPFFTTKMGQGGSGLGMSISYNIVTSLFGGEFEVDSSPGKGSSFVIRLPLEAPQHAAADPLIHSRH